MITRMLSAQNSEDIALAAQWIREGKLVAIPTETVYGLAANGLDEQAVLRIFQAKGRPQDNPLILHIAQPQELRKLCKDIPASAWLLADNFWPGPLTMVLPAREIIPKSTTAGLDTVAVRCPKTAATRALIAMAGVPLAAPSANRSGKPSTTTAQHVLSDMDGRITAILDGGACEVGVESTIVDLTGDIPRLLRPGGVTPEELIALLGELQIDPAVLAPVAADAVVRAPGMKYRHYAPAAPLIIVTGSAQAAAFYIRAHFQRGDAVLCFEEELPLYQNCNPTSYGSCAAAQSLSSGLFAALRALDRPDIGTIYARCPEGGGMAYAVGNRLKKAAGFHIVNAEDAR
ncbi:MAG: threonylcarbamoyl-AMP synthase [Oscillospiraceae bacterium]|jgi:L-threonylcarbamoyladenylate synthase|nr:threonylcarbamoyl-AMP synthase [Oscillospiraceae bacterium]